MPNLYCDYTVTTYITSITNLVKLIYKKIDIYLAISNMGKEVSHVRHVLLTLLFFFIWGTEFHKAESGILKARSVLLKVITPRD